MDFLQKYILPITLGIGSVMLLNLNMRAPETVSEKKNEIKKTRYRRVKRMENDSARELEMQKDRIELENSVNAPHLDRRQSRLKPVPHVVDITPSAEDFSRERGASVEDDRSFEGQLNAFLADKQEYERLEGEKKKEYVQLFLLQAEKMGYKVTISDDLEITRVEKIPSQ